MSMLPNNIRKGPLAIATVAMLASIWVFGWIADGAGAQDTPDHSDVAHNHGFSGPGDVADWPPRPTGATTDLAPADGAAVADILAAPAMRAQAAALPMPAELVAALGTDWIHVSSSPGRSGKDEDRPPEDTYFSRDLNQTVIMYSHSYGPEVLTFPASQIQPIVTPGETITATELGRAALLDQGFSNAADLDGFGIRALDDGQLYPVRMVYITYSNSWFDDPLYSALVDMTNGVVVEAREL